MHDLLCAHLDTVFFNMYLFLDAWLLTVGFGNPKLAESEDSQNQDTSLYCFQWDSGAAITWNFVLFIMWGDQDSVGVVMPNMFMLL